MKFSALCIMCVAGSCPYGSIRNPKYPSRILEAISLGLTQRGQFVYSVAAINNPAAVFDIDW